MPKHMAINLGNAEKWAIKTNSDTNKTIDKTNKRVLEAIDFQLKKDIPVLTLNLIEPDNSKFNIVNNIIKSLLDSKVIYEEKVRVYVVGDWYGTDIDLIENIKKIMDKTKDYDKYFLNLCINYTGQKEILTALKLLVKKTIADKLSIDELKLEDIKDNLSTSYFIPPELIIETEKDYSGLLLWDSVGAVIYYVEKYFQEIDKGDIEKAVSYFNKLNN